MNAYSGNRPASGMTDRGDLILPARALASVRTRRIFAFLVDLVLISFVVLIAFMVLAVLGIVTFGLTWLLIPPLYPIVAFLYNGLTMSGAGMGTPGMRVMDLEARLSDGYPVPFLNAAVHAILFYIGWTIAVVTPVMLLVSLFSRNKRCLHDMLADIVITRRQS